jgi:cytochrome c oxidase assembly protein subunit 15
VLTLLGVLLAQGAVGYVQYVTDLPVALVLAHVLGACLVWIATLRVLAATRSLPTETSAPPSVAGLAVPVVS